MRVLKNNILVIPIKEGNKKTSYGLELSEKHRDAVRYEQATVIKVGEDIKGVDEGDIVVYDKRAGFFIELDDFEDTIRIISDYDVKLIL